MWKDKEFCVGLHILTSAFSDKYMSKISNEK